MTRSAQNDQLISSCANLQAEHKSEYLAHYFEIVQDLHVLVLQYTVGAAMQDINKHLFIYTHTMTTERGKKGNIT